MGILDEAIREHLDLKRQHGAGDSELRELEDEAFGAPARPGDAPSEPPAAEVAAPAGDEARTELLARLQEAPSEQAEGPPEPAEAPPEPPVDEEHPAIEQSTVESGDDDAGTAGVETEEHPPPEGAEDAPEPVGGAEAASTADQPTELYDVGEEPAVEPAPVEDSAETAEDEYFSEQSLSDELDQALDAPEAEQGLPPAPEQGLPPETLQEPDAEEEVLESAEPEGDAAFQPEEGEEVPEEGEDVPEEGEDVLEETPEFLQDTPEHDRLWFEQKPPKDFDFDD